MGDVASFAGVSTAELERSLATIRKGKQQGSPSPSRRVSVSLVKALPLDTPYVFYNWARTFTCTPESVYYPTNELQIRQLVELAKREKRCLRAFGAGHSPSDLACVGREDWMVQMDGLNKLLKVSGERLLRECWATWAAHRSHIHLFLPPPSIACRAATCQTQKTTPPTISR